MTVETTTAAPIVSLRGIAKTFANGTVAVSRLDLDLEPGSFVSLLGPSGCGKSTVLRMIAGLVEPSSGAVVGSRQAGRVGFVFQEPTLMPWATALANVMLPLDLMGIPRAQARARAQAALRQVDLDGFEEAFPRELSGGMKMRVSLARALATEPDILLLDEPFAALDEITRFKLNNDLYDLWQAKRFTAVFVTHSVFESVYLSQRVVVMAARPGRVSDDLVVDAGGRRGPGFRNSPAYRDMCDKASSALEKAMNS